MTFEDVPEIRAKTFFGHRCSTLRPEKPNS
jgi:hypothetical protein